MIDDPLVGEDGALKPDVKAQAEELVTKITELCKEYPPAITLFVLEAVLEEEIHMYSPPISGLFQQMMKAFKYKATILISTLELLKDKGISVEDLIKEKLSQTEEPTSGI